MDQGQREHAMLLADAENELGHVLSEVQLMHAVAWDCALKDPGAQAMQAVAVAEELNVPAAHDTQLMVERA